ncbi:MAG: hypothetical protein JXO22_13190, partial [Phycisphaerae bacterium]|nr:hypothetical protein [Phycisphaerae bacterium]
MRQIGRPLTGELAKIEYDDGITPAVEYGYTSLGQLDWVKDGAGKREFDYDPDTFAPLSETFVDDQTAIEDLFLGKVLTQLYEDANGLEGRWR